MPETKNLLLRLDPELAEQLQAVAAVEERPVSVLDDEVPALLDAVVSGDLSRRDLMARLAARRRTRRLVGTCPACGRELHVLDHEVSGHSLLIVGMSRFELVARCWFEHRAHGRAGQPLPAKPAGEHAGVDATLVPA